jgi:hypothetical protein
MMNRTKKITTVLRQSWLIAVGLCVTGSSQAEDLLSKALQGNVGDSLGSGSMFWKIFILADIILATAMAVKTKNPMVFVGVAGVAFIPAFLLKTLVF